MQIRVSIIVAVLLLTVSAVAAERFSFERPLMGTRFVIVCYANEQSVAERAADAAFKIAAKVEETASDYMPSNELSMLGSSPTGNPIPVSPLLYGLLDHSRRMAEATGGAFDPTLGPLTKLWREARKSGAMPDQVALNAARANSGWEGFTLDPDSQSVTLWRENMSFDLGAVAKGYVADLMLASLVQNGLPNAMVVAGGDIRLGDPPPGRAGWRVALQTFDLNRADEVITLSNAAVSTSGDLHQFVEIDGVRYSHILSPHSGAGLTQRIAAIVVADEGKLSDPLSTAACVLGPEGADKLRDLPGVREIKFRTPRGSIPVTSTTSNQSRSYHEK